MTFEKPRHVVILNLEAHWTEVNLKETLSSFGIIKNVVIGEADGARFASVEYATDAAAKGAVEGMAQTLSIRLDPKGGSAEAEFNADEILCGLLLFGTHTFAHFHRGFLLCEGQRTPPWPCR